MHAAYRKPRSNARSSYVLSAVHYKTNSDDKTPPTTLERWVAHLLTLMPGSVDYHSI
jgi:hypothetical protein